MSLVKRGVLPLAIGLVLALQSNATDVPEMSIGQVLSESKALVHGVVVDQFSEWEQYDGHKILFTYSTIRVRHADFMSMQRSRDVVVRTVGGTLDGYTQLLIDEASFKLGEEVVVFLGLEPDWAHFSVTGFRQGKYTVVRDGAGRITGMRPDAGAQVDSKAAEARQVVPLETFASSLRHARKLGAGDALEIHPLVRTN
jgi:hypothetical protein